MYLLSLPSSLSSFQKPPLDRAYHYLTYAEIVSRMEDMKARQRGALRKQGLKVGLALRLHATAGLLQAAGG